MTPEFIQKAITAYVKNWVRERNDAGEPMLDIAIKLGFKSHASIAQYLNPSHPIQVTANAQKHAANVLFNGSRDRLEEEAVRWYQQHRPPLPVLYERAVGILEDRHGRDFTDAAYQHLETRAAHNAEGLTAPLLADQIYELAQGEKNKSVPNRAAPPEDPPIEQTHERAAAKPKRKQRA